MQEVLKGLAFRWENDDPFHAMGFSLSEGPPPTLPSISQRWDMAEFILQTGLGDIKLKNEWGQMASVRGKIMAARDSCTQNLKNIKKSGNKKDSKKGSFGRWQEAGSDLLEYIGTLAPRAKICLQLSKVHPWEAAGLQVAEPKEAREIHDLLIGGNDLAKQVEVCMSGQLVVWAPGGSDALNRFMGNMQKVLTAAKENRIIVSALIPFMAPPGAQDFEDILDLVGLPLLGSRWDSLIEDKTVLLEPGTLTFSGEFGPVTAFKSFVKVDIGTMGTGSPNRSLVRWKECLASWNTGRYIIIDFPSRYLQKMQRLLGSAKADTFHVAILWSGMEPSRANTKDEPRSSCKGFLPREGISLLQVRVAVKEIRKAIGAMEGIVGEGGIFQDKAALMVEMTSWEAAGSICPLTEDLVALSPKWALMRTQVRSEEWEDVLSNLMRSNPYGCVLRVVWRQSKHGGRPWALPAATTQQIQAVRVQARLKLSQQGGKTPPCQESSINVRGNLGPNPGDVLRQLMSNLQVKMDIALPEKLESDALGNGEWSICLDHGTGIPTGKIKIQLENSLQVSKLQKAAGKQIVYVNGEARPIEVCNFQAMPLPRLLGNGVGAI